MKEVAASKENIVEKETVTEEENVTTDQEFNPFITPEYLAYEEQEEERRRKESKDKANEGVNDQEQPFHTDILQSPSHSLLHLLSSSKKTPSKSPSLPKGSPPKDPTPPASSPPSSNAESSSESSRDHLSPPPSETTSKHKLINEPVNPSDLHEQVKTLTTMVTNLAKQVEDFQGTKQQIDNFMKADLDGMIKTYTNDYLTDNLVGILTPQVTSLVEPIKENLEHRIKSVVRKMLSTTQFTL